MNMILFLPPFSMLRAGQNEYDDPAEDDGFHPLEELGVPKPASLFSQSFALRYATLRINLCPLLLLLVKLTYCIVMNS